MEVIESQLVLCTVKKIEKTNIFLDIEGDGEGNMVLSEVAAGRIRNLRDYIFPNKKIVCKVLSIEPGGIQLSLRRVTAKERESVLEYYKKEKRLVNMLKTIVKDIETINKIKEKYGLVNFFQEAQNSPDLLKKFFNKEEIERLAKIFTEKIEKEKIVKKKFKLSSISSIGLTEIKEILNIPGLEIHYLGSSLFSIEIKAEDFKEANKKILLSLEQIKQKAKEKYASFEIKEK